MVRTTLAFFSLLGTAALALVLDKLDASAAEQQRIAALQAASKSKPTQVASAAPARHTRRRPVAVSRSSR
jgi:hypothetical protein